jgi:hypothetical protein
MLFFRALIALSFALFTLTGWWFSSFYAEFQALQSEVTDLRIELQKLDVEFDNTFRDSDKIKT